MPGRVVIIRDMFEGLFIKKVYSIFRFNGGLFVIMGILKRIFICAPVVYGILFFGLIGSAIVLTISGREDSQVEVIYKEGKPPGGTVEIELGESEDCTYEFYRDTADGKEYIIIFNIKEKHP